MIITVISPHHKEKKSFIWSDSLPIDLAAKEAAKEYGYKEVDKYRWSFARAGVALRDDSILKSVICDGESVDLITLIESANAS